MNNIKTPLKKFKSLHDHLEIPPSPLMQKIGYGTGVAVYKLPRSSSLNRVQSPWAVKKLIKRTKTNKQLEKRLAKEAELLRQLNHPNIVGFRAFVKDTNGTSALAMEECKTSLGDMIETRFDNEEGPYSPDVIYKVCQDIASALNYLHNEALLIHCDIKSYNILVKGNFSICKLCDFGVSLPILKTGELDRTKAGEDVDYSGTDAWCAPEILDYPQIITSKADIYAYGLVIWEMIALSPPIDDEVVRSFSSSNTSFDELIESMPLRKNRPSIPEDIELGQDYEFVLELYYICTETDRDMRPSSKKLVDIFSESEKVKVSK